LVVACLLLAIPVYPQEQSAPRGVLAMEFDTGKDPNSPAREIRLKSVMRGGPAGLAGLRAGDVILKLNDQPVAPDNWFDLMQDFPPGSQVNVTYVRDGQTANTTVTVGDRVETFTRLASAGDAEAAVRLAGVYWNGEGVPKNKDESLRWYRRAAELGSVSAQAGMGRQYYSGDGVPKDLGEALRWLRMAADRGDLPSATLLGWMYSHGEGTPLNGAEALRYLQGAANQNNAQAQYYLGLMCANGSGIAKDWSQAVLWYRKAAEQGMAPAMTNLGYAYDQGLGVAKNAYEGANWYRKAAELGEETGEVNLALDHYYGSGAPQDYAEAYYWYLLAKANGFSGNKAGLDELPQKLTAEQMSAAQRRVAAWRSATLTITTDPPQATVSLNNQYRGATDANGVLELHDLAAGNYQARVSSGGFLDATRSFSLNPHQNLSLPRIRLRPATADLRFQTTPGGAQVYVNDEFKGGSSADGSLVVAKLPNGSYRVRVSLAGYNDWNQNVEVKPGAPVPVAVKLERAGPPPLSVDDVVGLLQGSVSPVRAATLVKERGVDFDLNDEVEKRIRNAGGDSELLLAIARSRKK
jgi:TPR repeat protein